MSNEQKVIPVQYIPIQPEEDEIDLRELIKTILKYKKLIVIFTLVITALAIVYVFIKKPVYEIQSNIMIGQINGKPVASNTEVSEYIKALYKKEIEKKFKKMPPAYLSNVTLPKKTDTFLTLTIDGLNNQYDLEKKNQILKNIQDAYNFKIKKYIISQQNKLQNLTTQLKSIDIEKIKNIHDKIKNLNYKIKIIKTVDKNKIKNNIKNLNYKIKVIKTERVDSDDIILNTLIFINYLIIDMNFIRLF